MSQLSHIWSLEKVDFIISTFIIKKFHSEFLLPKRSTFEKVPQFPKQPCWVQRKNKTSQLLGSGFLTPLCF